jgi:hypothetical protein
MPRITRRSDPARRQLLRLTGARIREAREALRLTQDELAVDDRQRKSPSATTVFARALTSDRGYRYVMGVQPTSVALDGSPHTLRASWRMEGSLIGAHAVRHRTRHKRD